MLKKIILLAALNGNTSVAINEAVEQAYEYGKITGALNALEKIGSNNAM